MILGTKGAIKYEQDELAACKSLVDQCLSDDPDTIISYASISFKEQGSEQPTRGFRSTSEESGCPQK